MMDLPALIAQLDSDITKEEALLDGYNLLSVSAELSTKAKQEVGEGFSYSSMRKELMVAAKNALANLVNHGYPQRQYQTASPEVVNELEQLVIAAKLAVSEFVNPPTAAITVSEETPV